MNTVVSIPQIFKSVVNRANGLLVSNGAGLDPLIFDLGHYAEVSNRITIKDQAIVPIAKYPVVWLVMDFKERHRQGEPGLYGRMSDVKLIIGVDTLPEYTAME